MRESKTGEKAAWAIFGDSYRYRARYNGYKAMRRGQEKDAKDVKPEKLPGQVTMEEIL